MLLLNPIASISLRMVCHQYPNPRNEANEHPISRVNPLLAPDAALKPTRQCLSPCLKSTRQCLSPCLKWKRPWSR